MMWERGMTLLTPKPPKSSALYFSCPGLWIHSKRQMMKQAVAIKMAVERVEEVEAGAAEEADEGRGEEDHDGPARDVVGVGSVLL
ncbi:unnamed protein product [Sphagnum balticum]